MNSFHIKVEYFALPLKRKNHIVLFFILSFSSKMKNQIFLFSISIDLPDSAMSLLAFLFAFDLTQYAFFVFWSFVFVDNFVFEWNYMMYDCRCFEWNTIEKMNAITSNLKGSFSAVSTATTKYSFCSILNFSRSTRFAYFCTAQISIDKISAKKRRHFCRNEHEM